MIFGCFCAGSLPTRLDSVKSSTTPWEPFTLILGFMLMLAKNPFRTIQKHPFALSVPNCIIQIQKTKKLWKFIPSSALSLTPLSEFRVHRAGSQLKITPLSGNQKGVRLYADLGINFHNFFVFWIWMMKFGTERTNGCFWLVLKGFFANINMKPKNNVTGSQGVVELFME